MAAQAWWPTSRERSYGGDELVQMAEEPGKGVGLKALVNIAEGDVVCYYPCDVMALVPRGAALPDMFTTPASPVAAPGYEVLVHITTPIEDQNYAIRDGAADVLMPFHRWARPGQPRMFGPYINDVYQPGDTKASYEARVRAKRNVVVAQAARDPATGAIPPGYMLYKYAGEGGFEPYAVEDLERGVQAFAVIFATRAIAAGEFFMLAYGWGYWESVQRKERAALAEEMRIAYGDSPEKLAAQLERKRLRFP